MSQHDQKNLPRAAESRTLQLFRLLIGEIVYESVKQDKGDCCDGAYRAGLKRAVEVQELDRLREGVRR